MLWLTWKQHRSEALVSALLVVVISVALISHGVISLPCVPNASCLSANQLSSLDYYGENLLLSFPWLLPLLVGVFVGAPLIAREREQHTYPLIWTQSITRNRWLTAKLSVIASVLMLAFTLLAVLTSIPYVEDWGLGIVLIGYGLFGFMLGVTIGAFVRRIVPAMLLTLVIFLPVFIALHAFSPYLIPPLTRNDMNMPEAGAIILYAGYTDSAGHEVGDLNKVGDLSTYCGFHVTTNDPSYASLAKRCFVTHNLQWKVVYQPGYRLWPLQLLELAVLLALSAALVPLTYWRLRQRRES